MDEARSTGADEVRLRRSGVVWNALGSTMFAANTLIMVVVVSRTSSVATVGCFGIALAVAQLLFNVGLFGVDLFQMTDYQRRYRFADYLWTRVLTCLLMLLACLPIVAWGMPGPEKKLLVVLLTVTFLTHAVGDLYQGLFFRENRLDLSGQALFFRVLCALVAFVAMQALTRDVALALTASIIANVCGIGIWGVYRSQPYRDHEGRGGREGLQAAQDAPGIQGLRSARGSRGSQTFRLDRVSSLLRSCFPLFISSFLVLFIFNAPRYGIDWLMDDTAQGYFSMIVLPALVINLAGQFIFRPVLSTISRALEAASMTGFSRILAQQLLIIAALTAAAALAMPFIGIPLLTMLYAVDLSGLSLEASLLVVGGGLFALNQLSYSVLVIMRRQTAILLAYGVGVAAALVITTGAIASLGLLGACLALALSQLPVLLLLGFAIARGLRATGMRGRRDGRPLSTQDTRGTQDAQDAEDARDARETHPTSAQGAQRAREAQHTQHIQSARPTSAQRVLVIIPAYNEAANIVRVVKGLASACPGVDFIVVNDGSTDETARLCAQQGFPLIDLACNVGLSGAVGVGMRYAWRHRYDVAIQFDADGQHRPEYLAALLGSLAAGHDIACGSRFVHGPKSVSLRSAGGALISCAIRLTTGHRLTDPTSGLRAYSQRIIQRFATQINMTPEPDTISYLIRLGARVSEVPVTMNERIAGTSYFGPVTSLKYMLRMAVSILLIQFFRKGELSPFEPL
jgi:O-antigen/teichoic acid export membrane protein